MKLSPCVRKQIKAIDLAIGALEFVRRQRHAMGEAAYRKGIDFEFAIKGHKHYTEYCEAIQQLLDLIEILADPGVTRELKPKQLQFEEQRSKL